ncbi:hypothetical protein WA026_019581, partial [Henosepilachna vigintioctopunctata]
IPKTSIIEMEVPQKTSIKIHIFLSYNDIPSTLVTTYEKICIMKVRLIGIGEQLQKTN